MSEPPVEMAVVVFGALAILSVAVLSVCYLASAMHAARQRAVRAVRLIRDGHKQLQLLPDRLWDELSNTARTWVAERFQYRLRSEPIETLKRMGITNVRWSALRSAGYQSLADLHGISAMRLQSLPGVGPTTAGRVAAATTEIVRTLHADPVALPSAQLSEPNAASLIQRVTAWIRAKEIDPAPAVRAVEATSARLDGVRRRTGFVAWLGKLLGRDGSDAIAEADALTADAEALLAAPEFQALAKSIADIEREVQAPPVVTDLVARYHVQRAACLAALERAFGKPANDARSAATAGTAATSGKRPPVPPARPSAEPVRMRTGAPAPRGYSIPSPSVVRVGPATISVTVSVIGKDDRAPDDARWHGAGEAAQVSGYAIPGGLLYVGRHLASITPYRGPDPALINPGLPVDMHDIDWAGERMTYWPCYSEVAPQCRGAYLRWLGDGRKHPNAYIGYVFLFFYGLERRLLHDGARASLPLGEREAILAEVERLLTIYGAQPSFRRYASEFLAVSRIQAGNTRLSDAPPPVIEPGHEMPLSVRTGLGELVRAGRPLPAEWALAWVRSHPETRWRTPAQRCGPQLERLFAIRYADRYGEGMVVKANRTPVTARYRPASASFGGTIGVPLANMPDVAILGAPLQKLRELAYSCVDDLEPYSRAIGRDSAARDTLAVMALLPKEIASGGTSAAGERLLGFVRSHLDTNPSAVVPARTLFEHAGIAEPWSRAHALSVAQWLQKAGYGVEPDIRFGSRLPKPTERLVIFRTADGTSSPTPAYNAAVALLNMAVMVAQADGAVDADEKARLTSRLQEAMHLDDAERERLAAHLQWLLATRTSLADVKKKAGHLEPARRDAVASFLVSVAAADGRLDRKEIEVLGRLYGVLGIEGDRLYTDLHGLGVPEATARPSRAADAFTLDRARVEAKLAESAAVSALLQDIFTSDEGTTPSLAAPLTNLALVGGFDAAHSGLLRELAMRESWSRAELEATAATLGILPDGALDVINERAYDVCGEPVIEGEDILILNQEVLKELMA
jgi:uncharacterized tellurite resistance protein B-like protein